MTLARRLLTVAGGGSFPPPEREHGPNFEWDTPLDDQWTTWDVTNGTYEIVDGQLVIEGPNVGLYRPIPAIPFTVTAYISAITNDASSYSDLGIMLGEATPGRFFPGCWDVAYLNQYDIMGSYWESTSHWNNNIGGGYPSHLYPPPVPHYSRFTVVGTDYVDGYFSLNGTDWFKWLDAYNPSFTIGSVGLDLHGTGTSMTVDWLRFT